MQLFPQRLIIVGANNSVSCGTILAAKLSALLLTNYTESLTADWRLRTISGCCLYFAAPAKYIMITS